MLNEKRINEELKGIDSLLRDRAFTVTAAKALEKAYQDSSGQSSAGAAWPDTSVMITKKYKEEKIAINLAGFYATECGIGVLLSDKGETPYYWLSRITNGQLDSGDVLLLNRFANATWKAGQPFRGIDRITRDNFISANFLSDEETKKDFDQISSAAKVLSDSLQNFRDATKDEQLKKIAQLLQDKEFAFAMASSMESAYYKGQNKPVPPFISPKEDSATVQKSAFDEKVATNIAGFYALECGISYLSATKDILPSETLKSIINNTIDPKDKLLLERFANATWKAGQPFISMDRITRANFVPASLLGSDEVQKDWVQIQVAAKIISESLSHPL